MMLITMKFLIKNSTTNMNTSVPQTPHTLWLEVLYQLKLHLRCQNPEDKKFKMLIAELEKRPMFEKEDRIRLSWAMIESGTKNLPFLFSSLRRRVI